MRNAFSTFVCVLLTVALVCGAVCIGAVRGWSGERQAAMDALAPSGVASAALQARAMDAANLAVVASRHLKDDADAAALRAAYETITGGKAGAEEIAQADEAISSAAASLAAKLKVIPTVLSSTRDQVYISTLTRTLSERSASFGAYAAAVEDYNTRLKASLTGRLAMLLGVEPLSAPGGTN